LGTVVSNLALSAEQAVLDKEIVSYINKLLEGIAVDEDTIAVDLIKETGSDGDFMSTEHTVRRARTEFWHSEFFHNGSFDAWIAAGRKGPLDLASQTVNDAMKADLPLLISEDAAREVDRVVEDAERALLQK
jgi:trimethylamine--corrinoid protein Co-methyltransferase